MGPTWVHKLLSKFAASSLRDGGNLRHRNASRRHTAHSILLQTRGAENGHFYVSENKSCRQIAASTFCSWVIVIRIMHGSWFCLFVRMQKAYMSGKLGAAYILSMIFRCTSNYAIDRLMYFWESVTWSAHICIYICDNTVMDLQQMVLMWKN